MAIGIIVGIVLAALFIGACCVCAVCESGIGKGIAGIIAVGLVIAFIIVPFSFRTVSSGEVAVVKHLGKIEGVKTAGTHFASWITNSYIKYDTKVQNLDTTTMAYSSDAQTMDIQMTIQHLQEKVLNVTSHQGNTSQNHKEISPQTC